MSALSSPDVELAENTQSELEQEMAAARARNLALVSEEKDAEAYAYELAYEALVDARAMTLDDEVRDEINSTIDVVFENAGWVDF